MRRLFFMLTMLAVLTMSTGCAVVNKYNPFPQRIYSSGGEGHASGKAAPVYRAYDPKTRPYTVAGKTYHPLKTANGYDVVGVASWYGHDFDGKLTASGDVYDMYGMTAAHKTLPLGTIVRVTNLANGRSVKLLVNDRGPFVDGRVIDLSLGAAKALGSEDTGLAKVRITAVSTTLNRPAYAAKDSSAAPIRLYQVRVGAFSDQDNALRTHRELLAAGFDSAAINKVHRSGRVLHVVQAGSYRDRTAAEQALRQLRKQFPSSYIVS